MGKGNRNRNDRYQDNLNSPGTKIKKKEINWLGTITVSVLAVLLVVLLVASLVGSAGLWLRNQKAANSDNFEVDGAMMTYFYNSYYDTWLRTYGGYVSGGMVSLDVNKPLKTQKYGTGYEVYFLGQFEGTWYDYFMKATIAQVETYLAYCEGAKADKIALDDEDYSNINEVISNYESAAKTAGRSLDDYLSLAFGKGVKESDVRKSLELIQLASKFYEKKSDENEGKITDNDIFNYFQNNLDKFVTADYLTFTFSETVTKVDVKDYTGKDDPEYLAAVEKAKLEAKEAVDKLAEELAACDTPEEFKGYIIEYLFNENFDDIYKNYKEKLSESETPNLVELEEIKATMLDELVKELTSDEEEKEEEKTDDSKKDEDDDDKTLTLEDAKKGVKTDLKKKIESGMTSVVKEKYAFTIKEDLGKWLFGGVYEQFNINPEDLETETETEDTTATTTGDDKKDEALSGENAKINTTKIIADDEVKDKYSSTVYFVTKEASREEYKTKDVGHLLVRIEVAGDEATDAEKNAARAKAQEYLDKYLAGELTKDAFEKIAEEYTTDSNVFYENVVKDQMVEEFNDWIYDEARKVGDTGIVETTSGYHVMYFVGDGALAWEAGAKEGRLDEVNEEYFDGIREKYKTTINQSVIDKIGA